MKHPLPETNAEIFDGTTKRRYALQKGIPPFICPGKRMPFLSYYLILSGKPTFF